MGGPKLIITGLGGGHCGGVQGGVSACRKLQRGHRAPGLSNGIRQDGRQT